MTTLVIIEGVVLGAAIRAIFCFIDERSRRLAREFEPFAFQPLRDIKDVCTAYGWPTGTYCGLDIKDAPCPVHGEPPSDHRSPT